ncbi:MAG: shikimate dehydrogenase family protein, partial [Acidimicrobiia bacterium]
MAGYKFALLGDPVDHSRSPVIHRVLFQLSGLEGDYQTIRADRVALIAAVSDLRSGVWDGLNVTMPLKRDAAGTTDSLSPQAERSRSVNTLVRAQTGIEGHST